MNLVIRTTGVEDYLPGGNANIKTLIVGGPDTGKTRWASSWPKPIYADCESGRGSIADRKVPYVEIKTSEDMLQWLRLLKQECSRPRPQRRWATAVVDTIDAFHRKVKDEWLQQHPEASSFSGWEAWGYLDTKMQMLMTRLLNLDMNVVILSHYKDKTRSEGTGDSRVEIVERMLQLQGDIKDSAFNDFDLVGRMGTYYVVENGERVEKRGLTFKKTPDWPFLKDRLAIIDRNWIEVRFDDSDFDYLLQRFMSKVDDLPEGEVVAEVEPIREDGDVEGAGATGPLGGGPVPPQDPKDMPLDQLRKDELIKMARSMPSIADEVKTNLLKAELVELIHKGREFEKVTPGEEVTPEVTTEPQTAVQSPAEPSSSPSSSTGEGETPVQQGVVHSEDGTKAADPGEILSPEQVAERLGATPVEDNGEQPKTQMTAQSEEKVCALCSKGLSNENPDFVRLSWIKFRKLLCNDCYQQEKQKAAAARS